MRRALAALSFVCLTGTLLAQAPIVQAPDSPIKKVLLGNSAITDITFGRAQKNGPLVTEMSGGVRFKVDGTEVTADEVTLDFRAGELRLRGDVRLKFR
jgi:lipopolysaccharide assembly outer membrane protein LptD (OstA)